MTRKRGRRILAVAVLLIWAGALAWHVRREYFQPLSVRLAEAGTNLTPASSFYAIRLGDQPIGFASSSIDTVGGEFVVTDDMRLRVRALGSPAPARAQTRIRLGRALNLEDFRFSLKSDFGDFAVSGAMRGDSLLGLRVSAGGEEEEMSVPVEGPILLPQVMPLHLALGGEAEPGGTYSYEIFDPSTLGRQRIEVEVLEQETLVVPDSAIFDEAAGGWRPASFDTVPTWHVAQRFGGVEIESWLDPEGRVVRATSPLGYTIERTAFEIAWNDYRALASARTSSTEAPDVIERTAISAGATLPEGRRLQSLTVRLKGVDLDGFDLAGGRQRLRGDTLVVMSEAGTLSVGYELPAEPDRWSAALESTPLIQADDPEIRRQAREVVGTTGDPAVAARRLTEWVYERLEKKVTLSVPSARQVLEAGRGDCNEHTVLYVALARAVGLPTRTAAGLVHVRGRFYYHAWPEVWLGRWVAVDPTLRQFPADAAHLRFVVGGLARQVELIRLIGSLELEVLAAEAT